VDAGGKGEALQGRMSAKRTEGNLSIEAKSEKKRRRGAIRKKKGEEKAALAFDRKAVSFITWRGERDLWGGGGEEMKRNTLRNTKV